VHEAWQKHCALPVIVLCRHFLGHFTFCLLHHLCFPGFSRDNKEIAGVFQGILCENIFPWFSRIFKGGMNPDRVLGSKYVEVT
jgi:hypothetical protein